MRHAKMRPMPFRPSRRGLVPPFIAMDVLRAANEREAAAKGDVVEIEKLVAEGEKPNLQDAKSRTPLHVAVYLRKHDAAGARMHQPGNRLQRRALADSVAAEQPDHLAMPDFERDAIQDMALPVIGVDVLDLEQWVRHHVPRSETGCGQDCASFETPASRAPQDEVLF